MGSMRKLGSGLAGRGRLLGLCGAALLMVLVAGCGSSGGGSSSSKPQGLWVPNYHGNTIAEFTGSTLKASSTPTADLTNSGADLNEPWGTAFDKKGNLWVTSYAGDAIIEYTTSQLKNLKTTPAPPANVVISESGSGPSGLIFDKSGNLWVSYWDADKIVEFTPSQLTTSGSPTPITITSSSLLSPSALAFDKSGNLWVANNFGGNVLEFTPSQLNAGGSQAPNITLATSSISAPYSIAFDHSGNLWVASWGLNTVLKFVAGNLTGTGKITPAATVTLSATNVTTSTGTVQTLVGPQGLAFDKSGNLWVSNEDSGTVYGSLAEFTPSQIAATGSPSPKVFLDSDASGTSINNPVLITFGPSIK